MIIVFKIGTNVLINNDNCLNLVLMQGLVQQISRVYNQGQQIIIITSGAVATGKEMIQDNLILRSSLAALGQAKLIKFYYDFFNKQNIKIAQVLLSPNSFKDRAGFDHLKETLLQLTNNKIIPIINENDTTTLKDTFGDNDSLAAMVAVISEAQKLVFLTNLEGFYSGDPKINQNANMIKEVQNIDLEIQKMCSRKTSALGRGGMLSKLRAAKLTTTCGIETYIISGLGPDNIHKLLIENQAIGTKFLSQQSRLSDRKKWLLIGTISIGKIIVDQGAREALENKNSLLAVGVRGTKGMFGKGEFVNIMDARGEIFAFGITNYGSKELSPLLNELRHNKAGIKKKYLKEIIHIDNLTLLK